MSGESTSISQQQLDRKFKHAADFGVVTTKKNPSTLGQFGAAIESHLNSKHTEPHGIYGFLKYSKVFFNPKTNNVVVLDSTGKFVTGFKLDPNAPQFENYMKNGILR
ncbi:colicin D domain-containing protein [Microvirgula sp. AG722]|uniref:colicin D domain-containing protein n=1 Tax=Microvirgula sp. AG722 TaxID=2183901 RepID=UPI000DD96CA7|nr:colicin D domain-containing protein [Microvirgula sp. AG722]